MTDGNCLVPNRRYGKQAEEDGCRDQVGINLRDDSEFRTIRHVLRFRGEHVGERKIDGNGNALDDRAHNDVIYIRSIGSDMTIGPQRAGGDVPQIQLRNGKASLTISTTQEQVVTISFLGETMPREDVRIQFFNKR